MMTQDELLAVARVDVFEPCACVVCQNPRSRWFQCPTVSKRRVEAYDAPACDGIPLRSAIAEIRAMHPGCDLVYIGAPGRA
jgi:hypothetical protein